MRIKQLELQGFKSFVDRTVLSFSPGVSSIVGPNGCGKSNVVDAIRWSLGEQSPKHLRGAAMEDVIFKGNDRRAPQGMAEVTLTFENDPNAQQEFEDEDLSLSTVPAHVLGLTEISVTRRYYRSGESEYLINKQPCRLRDITELFLGTGAGTKAYSIIEQGKVEQLINAKPEDRRWFIEEAAGTTLYRTRKVAAERKMERTRENLLRVSDILREVERQIQYLHRQAKKAEQYRSVQAEIRGIDLTLARAQWRTLATDIAALGETLRVIEEDERQATSALEQAVAGRATAQEAANAADHDLGALREQAARARAEMDALRQRRAWIDQQWQERTRRVERLAQEAEWLRERGASLIAEAEQIERERGGHVEALDREEASVAALVGQIDGRRSEGSVVEAAAESAKDRLVGILSGTSELRNQGLGLQRRSEESRRRLERLEVEQREATERLSAVDAELEQRRAALEQLRGRLSELRGERDERSQRLRLLADERRAAEERASQAQTQLMQLRSRLQSIGEIQRNYEGYDRGVRSIMVGEEQREGVLGVVADVISAPQEFERAVAAVLGERLQYMIVAGADQALDAVQVLREGDRGRGSFIPRAPRKLPLNPSGLASLNGSTRPLIDVVDVRDGFRDLADQLLGDVMLVPDLGTALTLWRRNGVYVTMVTPEGDVMDPAGVVTGGSESPVEEEILARRREMQELEISIDALSNDLDQATAARARLQASEATESAALKELDAGVHALTLDAVATEKDCERLEAERPRWTERLEVARLDTEALQREEIGAAEEIASIQVRLAELQVEQSSLELDLQARQQESGRIKAEVDALSEELTAARVRLAEARERQVALSAREAHVQQQRSDAARRSTDLAEESREAQAARAQLDGEREEVEGEITRAESGVATLDERIQAAAVEVDRLRRDAEVAEAGVNEWRGKIDGLRGQRGANETALAERRIRVEHLESTMQEKYTVVLADEVAACTEDEGDLDPALPTRLEELRQRLARIGEVNVGAIEELQELEQRAVFLRTQKEDLEKSLADLESTINKLNRASRARFRETFDQVDQKFRSVFPRLFRGGEAHLVLTDENNLLESGVEIFVRPPGKKLDTVTLLSGGEKALVAVSLIFALFLIRPTPFCFLDEIDAPLDDANVGRFVQMVREISGQTQFIIITHNKRTMEAADSLYGVTMEEPGVSKVISVAMH